MSYDYIPDLVPRNYSLNKETVCNDLKKKSASHYEKNRIWVALSQIGTINIQNTEPYRWMLHNFGRAMTQKEFIMIYRRLKSLFPGQYAPNRNTTRSIQLRTFWMNQIWKIEPIGDMLRNEIRNVIENSSKSNANYNIS